MGSDPQTGRRLRRRERWLPTGAATACAIALVVAAPASAADRHESWAASAIELVTSRGIFPGTPATFRPADPLTAATLSGMVAALRGRTAGPADAPASPVSIARLDASLVDALGLGPVARQFAAVASSAGLDPPSRFGTEVVARLLGLRHDLPASEDGLELQPDQVATRADAAFSAARVLALGASTATPSTPTPAPSPAANADAGGGVQYVQTIAAGFAVPGLSPIQQQIIRTAVSLIGYPYVWHGDDEKAEPGFDCSGLVWRVYKLAAYASAPGLSHTVLGRTAAQLALEAPRAQRIHLADLEPADLVFFRPTPHAKASQIDHVGIYLGNGWLIESAGQGVALGRLDWYGRRFAWGRRPLAQLGLEAGPGG